LFIVFPPAQAFDAAQLRLMKKTFCRRYDTVRRSPYPIVFFHGVLGQRLADALCRVLIVFAHDLFEFQAPLFIAAVINSVRIKKEDVPGAPAYPFSFESAR